MTMERSVRLAAQRRSGRRRECGRETARIVPKPSVAFAGVRSWCLGNGLVVPLWSKKRTMIVVKAAKASARVFCSMMLRGKL